MPLPRLEVFDTGTPGRAAPGGHDRGFGAFEEAKLAAYEQGYQAGWDDAAAAQVRGPDGDRGRSGAKPATLSFTYQEARSHILQWILSR
jgi:hypothetical protein